LAFIKCARAGTEAYFLFFFIDAKITKAAAKALIIPKVPTGFSGITNSGSSGLSGGLFCGEFSLLLAMLLLKPYETMRIRNMETTASRIISNDFLDIF